MTEHAGRIPLVRRRRRRPPSPWEYVSIFFLLTGVCFAVSGIFQFWADTGGVRFLDVASGTLNAVCARLWAPIALPALRRWWWGE